MAVEQGGARIAVRRRRRGFGIAAKVILALLLSFAVALAGLVLLGKTIAPVGADLRLVAEARVPALLRGSRLLEEAYRLAALGPDILITRTPLSRAELSELAQAIKAEKQALLAALAALDVAPEQIGVLARDFAALEDKLADLMTLTGELFALEQRLSDATGRLRRISANIAHVDDARTDACLVRWQASARQAVVELMAVHGARSQGWLARQERAYRRALTAMSRELKCARASAPRPVLALDREIRELAGSEGPIGLRRRQIALRVTLESQLGRGRYLGDSLTGAVESLLGEVARSIADQSRRVDAVMDRYRLVLLLVTLALALITLATAVYLHRALVAPITRLRRAIDAAGARARPGPQVPFPPAGADEIGAIIASVRGFVAEQERHARELGEAKAEAEAANRAKTQFLAQMSHDLRTPLNAVLGYADLLHESDALGERDRARATSIRRGAKHLLRLIEDLLDAAAIEVGKVEPVIGELDLAGLLQDLDDGARSRAQAKGLWYRSEHARTLPRRIRTDGRRVRQVLTNLLDNAVNYTQRGGVCFRARVLGATDGQTHIRFEVEDTGPGIDAREQARLFEPFQRIQGAQPGTGLGLAICRQLATLLGGSLGLESAPGRGSLFRFELPAEALADSVGDDAGEPVVTGYLGARRRLLIVDDDPVNRLFLADLLTRLGFEVAQADGAAAAVEVVRGQVPDLVLMDMVMPQVCGYAATWALRRELHAELPVIAASATPLPGAGDVAELGFDGFVTKPIVRAELVAAIGACLRLRWTYDHPQRGDDRARLDASTGALAAGTSRDDDPEPPPPIEIDTLRELMEMGERDLVLAWCDDLAAGDPDFAPFAERVRALAGKPSMARLRDWLAALR